MSPSAFIFGLPALLVECSLSVQAGEAPPVKRTLLEGIWVDVTCLDANHSKLVTTRRMISPYVPQATAGSFRLFVHELEALEGRPADLRSRRSFVSKDLDRQLGATCVIDLDADQLWSAPAPRRSYQANPVDAPACPNC